MLLVNNVKKLEVKKLFSNFLDVLKRHKSALFIFISLIYYLTYFNYGLDLDDEGYFLNGGKNILLGKWPITDFFSYPPFTYFCLAFFYKIFGLSVFTERIFLLLILLVNIKLLLVISEKYLSGFYKYIPVAMYAIAPGPWYKIFYIFYLILFFYFLLNLTKNKKNYNFFVLGLIVGFVFIGRYEAGILAFLISIFSFLLFATSYKLNKDNKDEHLFIFGLKKIFLFLLGFLLVFLSLYILYFTHNKSIGLINNIFDYYLNSSKADLISKLGILNQFELNNLINKPSIENYFYFISFAITTFLFAFSTLNFFSGSKKIRNEMIRLSLLAAVSFASLAYSYFFVWNSRMLSTFPIVYILVCKFSFESRFFFRSKKINQMLCLIPIFYIISICYFCKVQNYSGSLSTRFSNMVTVNNIYLKNIYIYSTQYDDIISLMQTVKNHKNASLIPMSESSTLGFLSGLSNPTYYSLFTTDLSGVGEPQKLIDKIESLKINYFVARRKQFRQISNGLGSNLDIYAPDVKRYLMSKYHVQDLGKGFVVLIRNPE